MKVSDLIARLQHLPEDATLEPEVYLGELTGYLEIHRCGDCIGVIRFN
jgi:hypothetical protein